MQSQHQQQPQQRVWKIAVPLSAAAPHPPPAASTTYSLPAAHHVAQAGGRGAIAAQPQAPALPLRAAQLPSGQASAAVLSAVLGEVAPLPASTASVHVPPPGAVLPVRSGDANARVRSSDAASAHAPALGNATALSAQQAGAPPAVRVGTPSTATPGFIRSVVAGDMRVGDVEGMNDDAAASEAMRQPRPLPPPANAHGVGPVEAAHDDSYERDGVRLAGGSRDAGYGSSFDEFRQKVTRLLPQLMSDDVVAAAVRAAMQPSTLAPTPAPAPAPALAPAPAHGVVRSARLSVSQPATAPSLALAHPPAVQPAELAALNGAAAVQYTSAARRSLPRATAPLLAPGADAVQQAHLTTPAPAARLAAPRPAAAPVGDVFNADAPTYDSMIMTPAGAIAESVRAGILMQTMMEAAPDTVPAAVPAPHAYNEASTLLATPIPGGTGRMLSRLPQRAAGVTAIVAATAAAAAAAGSNATAASGAKMASGSASGSASGGPSGGPSGSTVKARGGKYANVSSRYMQSAQSAGGVPHSGSNGNAGASTGAGSGSGKAVRGAAPSAPATNARSASVQPMSRRGNVAFGTSAKVTNGAAPAGVSSKAGRSTSLPRSDVRRTDATARGSRVVAGPATTAAVPAAATVPGEAGSSAPLKDTRATALRLMHKAQAILASANGATAVAPASRPAVTQRVLFATPLAVSATAQHQPSSANRRSPSQDMMTFSNQSTLEPELAAVASHFENGRANVAASARELAQVEARMTEVAERKLQVEQLGRVLAAQLQAQTAAAAASAAPSMQAGAPRWALAAAAAASAAPPIVPPLTTQDLLNILRGGASGTVDRADAPPPLAYGERSVTPSRSGGLLSSETYFSAQGGMMRDGMRAAHPTASATESSLGPMDLGAEAPVADLLSLRMSLLESSLRKAVQGMRAVGVSTLPSYSPSSAAFPRAPTPTRMLPPQEPVSRSALFWDASADKKDANDAAGAGASSSLRFIVPPARPPPAAPTRAADASEPAATQSAVTAEAEAPTVAPIPVVPEAADAAVRTTAPTDAAVPALQASSAASAQTSVSQEPTTGAARAASPVEAPPAAAPVSAAAVPIPPRPPTPPVPERLDDAVVAAARSVVPPSRAQRHSLPPAAADATDVPRGATSTVLGMEAPKPVPAPLPGAEAKPQVVVEEAAGTVLKTSGAHATVALALDTSAPVTCVECESAVATRRCHECADNFCDRCFTELHKKGRRAEHLWTPASPPPRMPVRRASGMPSAPSADEQSVQAPRATAASTRPAAAQPVYLSPRTNRSASAQPSRALASRPAQPAAATPTRDEPATMRGSLGLFRKMQHTQQSAAPVAGSAAVATTHATVLPATTSAGGQVVPTLQPAPEVLALVQSLGHVDTRAGAGAMPLGRAMSTSSPRAAAAAAARAGDANQAPRTILRPTAVSVTTARLHLAMQQLSDNRVTPAAASVHVHNRSGDAFTRAGRTAL